MSSHTRTMKLRTRFFLIVGGLFLLAFIAVIVLEELQVDHHIHMAEKEIETKFHEINLERQQNIHRYLRLVMGNNLARSDNLLEKVYQYQWMKDRFLPTIENYDVHNWFSSAVLLASNEWVDLVQVTNDDRLTACLVVNPPYLNNSVHIPLSENVHAFLTQDDSGDWVGPFIGVPYWMNKWIDPDKLSFHETRFISPEDWDYWLLFDPETLATMDLSELLPKNLDLPAHPLELTLQLKGDKVYKEIIQEVVDELKLVQDELKTKFSKWLEMLTTPKRAEWIDANLQKEDVDVHPSSSCPKGVCSWEYDPLDVTNEYQMDLLSFRYDEIRLIFELCTFTASGLFEFNPHAKQAPLGITRFKHGNAQGIGMMTKNALYNTPFSDVSKCPPASAFESMKSCLSSTISVIYQQNHPDLLFLGNSIRLVAEDPPGEYRTGYLTVGTNANSIIRELALATESETVLVVGGKVFKDFSPNGQQVDSHNWTSVNFEEVKEYGAGVLIGDNNQEYYFVHIQPYEKADMDVFVFKLQESEATIYRELALKTRQLTSQMAWQFIVIALVSLGLVLWALSRVIKRIIRPITTLASCAKKMGEGHLDEALPDPSEDKGSGEVETLYTAFVEMIKRVKDSELARSALNKFVAPSVAEEVVKGHIELGGEEKLVTMMFIDVRGFTKLTEMMNPREVLGLLNECMTKISAVIDEHEGVIDKYIGDGLMSFFGAPMPVELSSVKAIDCAIGIRNAISHWNIDREASGQPRIDLGFGINTGLVVVGNMGSSSRLDYTAVGANVNLASRICSFAQPMEILISQGVYESEKISTLFETESIEPIEFKGFSKKVPVYRVLRRREEQRRT